MIGEPIVDFFSGFGAIGLIIALYVIFLIDSMIFPALPNFFIFHHLFFLLFRNKRHLSRYLVVLSSALNSRLIVSKHRRSHRWQWRWCAAVGNERCTCRDRRRRMCNAWSYEALCAY